MSDKDKYPDTDLLRRLREEGESGRRAAEEARRLAEQEAARRERERQREK